MRIRFAAAGLLLIASCVLMLAHSLIAAIVCLLAESFLLPREVPDLSDSGMRRWLRGVGIRLAIVAAVVAIVFFHPFLSRGTAERVMFHPAFVLPVWLLMLWSLFRCWRGQKESSVPKKAFGPTAR